MKHVACSKMWTDINIVIPRKKIKNCCKRTFIDISNDDIDNLGPDLFLNNKEYLADKRFVIENNKLPNGCHECKSLGDNSYWNRWNQWKDLDLNKENIDLDNGVYVDLIEIALSTTCNMTCIYCKEDVSSSWNELLNIPVNHDREYKTKLLDSFYKFVEQKLLSSNSKKIEYDFIGGEPLLDLQIFDVLERLIEIHKKNPEKELVIGLITNLNVKPLIVQRLIERASKFDNIKWILKLSIDGFDKFSTEQRDGLNLDLWKQNFNLLVESNKFTIRILPTVTNVSLPSLYTVVEYVVDVFKKNNQMDNYGTKWSIVDNLVSYPKALFVGTLPISYIQDVDKCIEISKNLLPLNRFEQTSFYKFLLNLKDIIGTTRSDQDKDTVKEFFDRHSKIKNKNYYSIFPVLKDILDK